MKYYSIEVPPIALHSAIKVLQIELGKIIESTPTDTIYTNSYIKSMLQHIPFYNIELCIDPKLSWTNTKILLSKNDELVCEVNVNDQGMFLL